MSFDTLGLLDKLVSAVSEKGYSIPTPIQLKAIPAILKDLDIMGCAQTGTGKTAGFTLPILQKLSKYAQIKGHRPVRALILTPTRELAAQIEESVETYGKNLALKSTAIFGGVNINPQIRKLRHGVDILVATPGRLLDHAGQKTVDLSKVDILVLDEADRMLDMGFINDVKKIIKLLPSKRQNLLFSATFSNEIKKLANTLLNSPITIEVSQGNIATEQVEHLIHPVDRKRKGELLSHLISSQNWKQVLVFTRTKHGANRLSQQLEKDGITSAAIHGNKSQAARTLALKNFKDNTIRVLVATDIAARGLDINQLPYVVNFELPHVPEDYIHRIGRTGRAGYKGKAISLVCIDERKLLIDIQLLIKIPLPKLEIPGYEPDPSIRAEPILNGRNNRGSNNSKSKFSFGRTGSNHSKPRSKSNQFGKQHGKKNDRRGGVKNLRKGIR